MEDHYALLADKVRALTERADAAEEDIREIRSEIVDVVAELSRTQARLSDAERFVDNLMDAVRYLASQGSDILQGAKDLLSQESRS